jgi:YhcH/YjgK/YiaL family protein
MKTFAVSYHRNPERWNKAFAFLRDSSLATMKPGRYELDGENLFVSISDYKTKEGDEIRYEAHEKYIDIQYVAAGYEKIGITSAAEIKTILQPYDPAKDIKFLGVKRTNEFEANQGSFFIFFPEDIHKPGIKDRFVSDIRKIVVKVKKI